MDFEELESEMLEDAVDQVAKLQSVYYQAMLKECGDSELAMKHTRVFVKAMIEVNASEQ